MTAHVNMINLQIRAEDQIAIDKATTDPATGDSVYDTNIAANSKHYLWQSTYQTIPQGMDGNPVQFAQKLRESLPEVNALRLGFNEYSFNPDGSLHPQYEAFLAEAVAQGFDITFVYTSGDIQNIGNSGSKWGHTDLTNAEAYAALQANFTDMQGAWTKMLDWLDDNSDVDAGVYGLELMNEPAGYRHAIRENGDGDGYTLADFLSLYTTHSTTLADTIAARSDAKILVAGWGFSGDFATLANTQIGPDGETAVELIRDAVGDALVWSSHFYPGWAGSDDATSVEDLTALLETHFGVLGDDAVLITETNAHGTVDNFLGGDTITDLFVAAYEWFADKDIGLGWFPGAETGGSNFVVIDPNGSMRFLHQHSYAHGMNAFSLGERDDALDGNDTITATLISGKLRNESYESDYSINKFDPETALGVAFGYEGDDTLNGTDGSNDMLYGGFGNDSIYGGDGDDFLFGQQGNDSLFASAGINHFFGGSGNDRMFGGSEYDQMRGGVGYDVFATNGAGDDVILDFNTNFDLIDLQGALGSWALVTAGLANTDADNDGDTDDVILTTAAGSLRLINVTTADLTAAHFVGMTGANGTVDGTASDDLIALGTFADAQAETVTTASNRIDGEGGDDTIVGGAADDTIHGGSGADTITGADGDDRAYDESGNDTVSLGDGDDYLRVGGGKDSFDGGDGKDYISYYDSTGGVTVNLETGETSGSWASNDTISNFESLSGSRTGGDKITGTSGANTIKTYGGDDSVYAGSGGDKVYLGDGDDYVRVGGGVESFYGGDGSDDYISYYDSSAGVQIDLQADTVSGSWASNDTISGFESAGGSKTGHDKMYGTSGANRLKSYGGNDSLYGRSGDDKLYGGSGADRFDGGHGDDTLYGGTGDDVFHFDRTEDNDTIKDFENNQDTIQFDNFSNLTDAASALVFATETGDDVFFDFGADGTLLVENTTKAQLLNDIEIV